MTEDMYTPRDKTWAVIVHRELTGSSVPLVVTAPTKEEAERKALIGMPGWIAYGCKVP